MQIVAPTNKMNVRIALIDGPRIVRIKHFASDSVQPNGHKQKMEPPPPGIYLFIKFLQLPLSPKAALGQN